jgi:nucleoside-diphosphate-sugar epimerase
MKVLLAGGSGMVGTFITPYLMNHHEIRVLDPVAPKHDVEHVKGSMTNPDDIRRALDGVDTFIDVAMLSPQGGASTSQNEKIISDNYQINCQGLHLLLFIAQEMGVKQGVYTSSMSVHYRGRDKYPNEDEVPLDTPSAYGLTKGFGELICRYFSRWFDMNLISLRITGPRPRDRWLEGRRNPPDRGAGDKLFLTDEEDLANAYLAALERVSVGHGLFDAYFIAGDENGEEMNLSKAKRDMGWEPLSQKYHSIPQMNSGCSG